MNIYIGIVVAYLVLITISGVLFSRNKVKDSDDFMVAGRQLPTAVLLGTLLATWCGSGSIIGGASFIYTYGPIAAIFFFLSEPIGTAIFYFLADKIRRLSVYTVPEIIEKKYGKTARLLAAICIVLSYVGIASYQFKGGGYILNLTTGISVELGTIISAVVVIILSLSGGMLSVAYTDALSSLLILVALGAGLIAIVANHGFGFLSQLPAAKKTVTGGLSNIQLLGFILPTVLLMLGDQNLYQRYSSAKDENVAKRSNIGFFFCDIGMHTVIVLLCAAAIILFPDIIPDTALLTVFMNSVPPVLGGLGLAAATAFIITTGDSYLLSAATNLTYDFYVPYFKPDASEEEKLAFTRIVIAVLGVLAYVMLQFFPSVLAAQMYSYTIYGVAITPPVLAAILWDKATKQGAITSMVIGTVVTLYWELVLKNPNGWNSVLISAPIAIITLIVVSLLTYKGDIDVAKAIED